MLDAGATIRRLRRLASGAILIALAPVCVLAQEASPPIAVAARIVDNGDSAKLTFDLSAPVSAAAHAMVDPDRIVVDLGEVNFQFDPSVGHPAAKRDAIVKAFRFGLFGPGKSRIVIDLGRPACIGKIETATVAKGAAPSRLSIELSRCEPGTFAAAARQAVESAASPQSAPPDADADAGSGPPVIVLDPGHGGVDGGAYGVGGATEKTIVYEYAMELKRRLEALNRFKVVLTRIGDQYVSLEDRVRIGREANAALFVSIHADAVSEGGAEVSGATVYTCSERASDAQAARIAEHENAADKAAGADHKPEPADVADILFDLKRRETRTYAHMFSRGVVQELEGATRLNRNPERSAGFVVLKAPDFPSVLVELGYLSNPQDLRSLTSPEWRAKAAAAMASAIDKFFPSTGAAIKADDAVA
ncbi:MAG: N-acetylmuramoyl-L-alanine amidase, partial [Hyphomicrobiales bacterium]|nr:N-acetylmuramoyl-L-alanine amidase [Hyphomicrobiales bacterium]